MGPKRDLGGGGTVGLGLAGNRRGGTTIQYAHGDPQIADLFFGYAFGYVETKMRPKGA